MVRGADGASPRRGPDGQRIVTVAARWPEGLICVGCRAKAMEVFGTCDGCGTQRLLPGQGPDGQR